MAHPKISYTVDLIALNYAIKKFWWNFETKEFLEWEIGDEIGFWKCFKASCEVVKLIHLNTSFLSCVDVNFSWNYSNDVSTEQFTWQYPHTSTKLVAKTTIFLLFISKVLTVNFLINYIFLKINSQYKNKVKFFLKIFFLQ